MKITKRYVFFIRIQRCIICTLSFIIFLSMNEWKNVSQRCLWTSLKTHYIIAFLFWPFNASNQKLYNHPIHGKFDLEYFLVLRCFDDITLIQRDLVKNWFWGQFQPWESIPHTPHMESFRIITIQRGICLIFSLFIPRILHNMPVSLGLLQAFKPWFCGFCW